MNNVISKESIQRLLKDVKQIIKNPLISNGIYYVHDESDMLKGYAMIVGPEDTPYFGGYYFFKFQYPYDYPHSPPKVTYCTNGNDVRFNPNLYKCGKVCISILNTWQGEQWTSCQTITTVLLNLCTLLCKDPLLNEPGVLPSNTSEIKKYNTIIEFANLDIAVCDILLFVPSVREPFFNLFNVYMKEHFLKNYQTFLDFVKHKKEIDRIQFFIHTRLYFMNIKINYKELYEKLENTHLFVMNHPELFVVANNS